MKCYKNYINVLLKYFDKIADDYKYIIKIKSLVTLRNWLYPLLKNINPRLVEA